MDYDLTRDEREFLEYKRRQTKQRLARRDVTSDDLDSFDNMLLDESDY